MGGNTDTETIQLLSLQKGLHSCVEGSVKGTVNVSWLVYLHLSAPIKQWGCSFGKVSKRNAEVLGEGTHSCSLYSSLD